MSDDASMKAAPLTIEACALCEDGTLAFVLSLKDPRYKSSTDPLWPKSFVVRVETKDMQAESARALVAQYEAADASPEAAQVRETNAFLGKLMGL